MTNRSLLTTYILWLFFGIFGAHHFYLKRYRHCFVWIITAGGVFGLGWFRDLWRIPDYLNASNATSAYVQRQAKRMSESHRPPLNSTRFAGQLILGTLFGYLTRLAIPDDYDLTTRTSLILLVVPPAVAIGMRITIFLKCIEKRKCVEFRLDRQSWGPQPGGALSPRAEPPAHVRNVFVRSRGIDPLGKGPLQDVEKI